MQPLAKALLERQGTPAQLVPVTVTVVSPLQVTMFGGTVNGVSIGGGAYVLGAANAIFTPGAPPVILPNSGTAIDAYTKAQTDALVASPGAISPSSVVVAGGLTAGGNIASSARVSSNGSPFLSVPSHNYTVTSSYVACWINGDGQFGTSASTRLVKTDLTGMDRATVAAKMSQLTPYWGRYVWDDPASPPKVFLLAEEVAEAGLGPDVAPVVEDEPKVMTGPDGEPLLDTDGHPVTVPVGEAYTVNYSQIVVPLLAYAQELEARIAALEAKTV